MMKRILLALALAASLGGGVLACNNPAGTSAPSFGAGGGSSSAPSIDAMPSVEAMPSAGPSSS